MVSRYLTSRSLPTYSKAASGTLPFGTKSSDPELVLPVSRANCASSNVVKFTLFGGYDIGIVGVAKEDMPCN